MAQKNFPMKSIVLIFGILAVAVGGKILWPEWKKRFMPPEVINIGINPWPGYEFLYLADKKGFFKAEGLNIRMVQFSSLQDVRQAFERGQIDGLCVTLVEMLQAYASAGRRSKIVIVADYSHGADVILAREPVRTLADLKGRKIGVEPLSVETIILARALDKVGLKMSDVDILNIDQMNIEKAIKNKTIDAAASYPPFSLSILKSLPVVKIFDTTQIPGEILDIVALSPDVIERNPRLLGGMRRVWEKTLRYVHEHRAESIAIMAEREGISPAEFEEALGGIHVLTGEEQEDLFFVQRDKLEGAIAFTARILMQTGHLSKTLPPSDFIMDDGRK